MAFPDEIIAGPVRVYIAPVGTAFPLVTAAPAATWILLGTQGDLNVDEDGVQITNTVDTADFTPLGAIQPVKSWLVGSDVRVEFTLADLTLEMLSHAYGGPATAAGLVTTTAPIVGTVGTKQLTLTRSSIPSQIALLIRSDQGPYSAAPPWPMQFELNRVSQLAEVPLQFQKGIPVKVKFEYRVFRDATGVGRIVAQHAAALP